MSDKPYYKTTVVITVLSEEPYTYTDLETLDYDIGGGACVGKIESEPSTPLTAAQMREALLDAGNDGNFFDSDEDF